MNVETSVTVTRAMIENLEHRARLVHEARTRLAVLGVATPEQLAGDPSITASPRPQIGDELMPWVHVTFAWELNN
jgi:hypothetical protein